MVRSNFLRSMIWIILVVIKLIGVRNNTLTIFFFIQTKIICTIFVDWSITNDILETTNISPQSMTNDAAINTSNNESFNPPIITKICHKKNI